MKAKVKTKPFTCPGCGAEKTPDGTPQNAPFVWYDVKTHARRQYCYDCDEKLLQDVELPLPSERGGKVER